MPLAGIHLYYTENVDRTGSPYAAKMVNSSLWDWERGIWTPSWTSTRIKKRLWVSLHTGTSMQMNHFMLTARAGFVAVDGFWLIRPFLLISLPRSCTKGVKPKDGCYSNWPVKQRITTAVWVKQPSPLFGGKGVWLKEEFAARLVWPVTVQGYSKGAINVTLLLSVLPWM